MGGKGITAHSTLINSMEMKPSRHLLRHYRKLAQLSQTALGANVNKSKTFISEVERGVKPFPVKMVADVAEACGCEIGDFFDSDISALRERATAVVSRYFDDPNVLDSDKAQRAISILNLPIVDSPVDITESIDLGFWKKDRILPFRSEKAIEFWRYKGDEIIIRGPARCGKSTLILEYVIGKMFENDGMQVLFARAFSVDLDAVRQNIVELMKYHFDDPLSPIVAVGGDKFHTLKIKNSRLELKGIDRPGGQLGAGYDLVVFSQAEQIAKNKVDVIASRCTPASENWIEDGVARSQIIYDMNPNRLDHWSEHKIQDDVKKIDFTFTDHPGYYDEDGNETDLFRKVYSRLDHLEGVWRQRLLEGKPANPEGTVFTLEPVHLLDKLPDNFKRENMFYRGFDFGMKDPSVCLWFSVNRRTGDIIVFREWRRVKVDTIAMGEAVKQFTDEHILMTVIDNDENLQSILKRNCGIVSELAQKGPNSIASGITLIQNRLKRAIDEEDGGLYFYNNPVQRDPLLIHENQPLTVIDESELYSWDEKADKPVDKYNHGWDIVRYMLDYLESQNRISVGFGGGGVKRLSRV